MSKQEMYFHYFLKVIMEQRVSIHSCLAGLNLQFMIRLANISKPKHIKGPHSSLLEEGCLLSSQPSVDRHASL